MSTQEGAKEDVNSQPRNPERDDPRSTLGHEPDSGELPQDPDSTAGHREGGMELGGPEHPIFYASTPEAFQEEAGVTGFHASYHEGPLPAVEVFQGYETVLPGAADRILTMAEKNQDSIIKNQRTTTVAEAVSFITSAISFSLLPWALTATTILLALNGHPVMAAFSGLFAMVSAGPAIINAILKNNN